MNKFFFTLVSFLLVANAIWSQVRVVDNKTIRYGSTSNIVTSGSTARYGQAQGVEFSSTSQTGTIIENGNGESSGIFMDKDKMVIWASGNEALVAFCNEDLMSTNSPYYYAAVAFIDNEGGYHSASDSTRKEDIRTIESSLEKILKVRGVEYYFKENIGTETTSSKSKKNGSTSEDEIIETKLKPSKTRERRTGFLAQELENVIPEAVMTNPSGIKYINYQAVIPFMVEAIKEQEEVIKAQSVEIEDIKSRLHKLEQLIATSKLR